MKNQKKSGRSDSPPSKRFLSITGAITPEPVVVFVNDPLSSDGSETAIPLRISPRPLTAITFLRFTPATTKTVRGTTSCPSSSGTPTKSPSSSKSP